MSARQIKLHIKAPQTPQISTGLINLIAESFKRKVPEHPRLEINTLKLPGEFRQPDYKLSLDGIGVSSFGRVLNDRRNGHAIVDEGILEQVQASEIRSFSGRLEALKVAEEAHRLMQEVPALRAMNLEPLKGRCQGREGDFIPALVDPNQRQIPLKILVDENSRPTAILIYGKNSFNPAASSKHFTLVAIANAQMIPKKDWPPGFAPSNIHFA